MLKFYFLPGTFHFLLTEPEICFYEKNVLADCFSRPLRIDTKIMVGKKELNMIQK